MKSHPFADDWYNLLHLTESPQVAHVPKKRPPRRWCPGKFGKRVPLLFGHGLRRFYLAHPVHAQDERLRFGHGGRAGACGRWTPRWGAVATRVARGLMDISVSVCAKYKGWWCIWKRVGMKLMCSGHHFLQFDSLPSNRFNRFIRCHFSSVKDSWQGKGLYQVVKSEDSPAYFNLRREARDGADVSAPWIFGAVELWKALSLRLENDALNEKVAELEAGRKRQKNKWPQWNMWQRAWKYHETTKSRERH